MTSIRWHKPKWLPRLLAMPVPEPSQQASRILAFQRSIILPAKVMFTGAVLYYLFFTRMPDSAYAGRELPSARGVVLEFMQGFFIFYVVFNALAATLLVLRRFPQDRK